MSPTLESFNRPFMRLWFYAALIEHAEFSLKLHNKVIVQTFRCVVALWKSWVCRYSIRFQVIKLKLLCETLRNEKWKILAWYPNKMRRYRQRNPKCGDWRWTNFQMRVALAVNVMFECWDKFFLRLINHNEISFSSRGFLHTLVRECASFTTWFMWAFLNPEKAMFLNSFK